MIVLLFFNAGQSIFDMILLISFALMSVLSLSNLMRSCKEPPVPNRTLRYHIVLKGTITGPRTSGFLAELLPPSLLRRAPNCSHPVVSWQWTHSVSGGGWACLGSPLQPEERDCLLSLLILRSPEVLISGFRRIADSTRVVLGLTPAVLPFPSWLCSVPDPYVPFLQVTMEYISEILKASSTQLALIRFHQMG